MKKGNKMKGTKVQFAIQHCEVDKVYHGNKFDYCTCKVDIDEDTYDLVRIAIDKEAGIEMGDVIAVRGFVRAFYNKDKKVTEYTFYAEEIKEVK